MKESVVTLASDVRYLRKGAARNYKELHELIPFFKVELEGIGADPAQLSAQVDRDLGMLRSLRLAKVGEATQQFPDVPADHWAAHAVRNLRANGVLRGYETGKSGNLFQGR
ncbi:N-acetylmuramoyl-L-alanine amidase, family 4 [Fimbriimonas ginsengisoli Gsoil 348]|uniref:N-acetylmuramoyl-L-alanine amidase, family 4 n=2 Tax=Fimbriimonas ginsengisoli TaxID=1005039 RepID=A0A068NVM9_FIMGI|nr:N-acetylmuramoyl-L-alanine amidase, family 4 [Fimbriimonas ginsengisoli Gsoil 348]